MATHANYGNNDADVRHAFSASYIWTPSIENYIHHGPQRLWSGWSIAGTFFYRTGLPFTVVDSATMSTAATPETVEAFTPSPIKPGLPPPIERRAA